MGLILPRTFERWLVVDQLFFGWIAPGDENRFLRKCAIECGTRMEANAPLCRNRGSAGNLFCSPYLQSFQHRDNDISCDVKKFDRLENEESGGYAVHLASLSAVGAPSCPRAGCLAGGADLATGIKGGMNPTAGVIGGHLQVGVLCIIGEIE